MSERDSENFDLDEEFVPESEDSTDYDGLLARVDKRVRTQGKKGKAAWSKLEEVLADRKLDAIRGLDPLDVVALGSQHIGNKHGCLLQSGARPRTLSRTATARERCPWRVDGDLVMHYPRDAVL